MEELERINIFYKDSYKKLLEKIRLGAMTIVGVETRHSFEDMVNDMRTSGGLRKSRRKMKKNNKKKGTRRNKRVRS